MRTRFRGFLLWLRNVLSFSKPVFLSLEYVDYIIDNKAYFLLSWHTRHAHKLNIKDLEFSSFQIHSSAYIAIPETIENISIKISNSWKSSTRVIQLKRIPIAINIDYKLKTNFSQLDKDLIVIPGVKLKLSNVMLKPVKVNVVNLPKNPKIKNLNYN